MVFLKLKIENVAVDKLVKYENNTRMHTDYDVTQIAKSIEKYGFNDPIAVWKDNIIIEGHGRLEASIQLGLKEVPVIRLDHLTDEQRREYGILHNKTAELSKWNFDMLENEIADLDLSDFDIDFDIDICNIDNEFDEHELEEINDNSETLTVVQTHSFSIDKNKYEITDEEYEMITNRLKNYCNENSTFFGFIRSILQ